MNNEELVALIQAGDRGKLVELWTQVRRMVYQQAARWAGVGGTTLEDLEQSGFIAMLRAVDAYDPTKAKFSTYLFQRLRSEFSTATGQHTKQARHDPLQNAVSLGAPLIDDDDFDTFADLIGGSGDRGHGCSVGRGRGPDRAARGAAESDPGQILERPSG